MRSRPPFILATRTFSFDDQISFARISGDTNPIHVDPVAARRSIIGTLVVHGVHTLLWCLDVLARSDQCPKAIVAIDIRFPSAAYLDEELTATLIRCSDEEVALRVIAEGRTVASIVISCSPNSDECVEDEIENDDCPLNCAGEPQAPEFESISGRSGQVDFAAETADFQSAFPGAARIIGAERVRGLAACSRLVGMDCPGLRSIFSRLTVDLVTNAPSARVSYRVTEADERFHIIHMDVAGAGLTGRIEAFAPPPSRQANIEEVSKFVRPDEFACQTALVIGGSRGLGELTAKIIAAGGGRTILTYAQGEADAAKVADEIRSFGGRSDIMQYDVTVPAASQLAKLNSVRITHVYYFATCRIAKAKSELFKPDRFSEFLKYYVHGLYDLCTALRQITSEKLSIVFPSTVYVENRPRDLTEYAMAKAAGEILCADMELIAAENASTGAKAAKTSD